MTEPTRREMRLAAFVVYLYVVGVSSMSFGLGILTGFGVLHNGPWWGIVLTVVGVLLFGLFVSEIASRLRGGAADD